MEPGCEALELSETKTLITYARTSAARFLGYEITVQHDDRKLTAGRRTVNGGIRLRVPREVIATKCARYMQRGKPERRPELMNEQDHAIISHYGAEYRGIVQYYLLAGDVYRLDRLRWVMVTSLLKTLAGKHDSTVTKIARKYAAQTPDGPRVCMQAIVDRGEGKAPLVATFGGIPLRRQKTAILWDRVPVRANSRRGTVAGGVLKHVGWSGERLCEDRARVLRQRDTAVRATAGLGRGARPVGIRRFVSGSVERRHAP